jgi:hypothetical protein
MDNLVEEQEKNLQENLIVEKDQLIDNSNNKYIVDYVNSPIQIVKCKIHFDENEKEIKISLNNTIRERVKYNDVIGGFIDVKSKILPQNYNFAEKKLFQLNFFPNVRITECNFCGMFCCKCCKNIQLRKVKVNQALKLRLWNC